MVLYAACQVAVALADRKRKELSAEGSARLDVLRTLAQEIGLVAVAAQDGCLCHVVGRAHIPCASSVLCSQTYCACCCCRFGCTGIKQQGCLVHHWHE